ncbi:arsenate reductase (glutaredoxin) [Flavobacterium sp. MXW15]|uniref:Arsenate reductase n=1 Tax=Xanthomonas chitinilytica TaxID=2989819 RepID=A0ABT3JZ75_9XANT|nr:arsenate reductase (glutaredoxin) [Xanthomonas sp. H13-6]MCW4454051.1 arsenate reductase (glutaredoxin) [Flavobacterium sp. MXW15]MCW4473781.1 arsenate reductase (glutaredoxin) [Xanthomonas sp. H13-6]
MKATIWHNPRCSNSRGALEILRGAGIEPVVVEYLKTPPDRTTLKALVARMGIAPRGLLRDKEAAYAELGLADPALDDDALIDAMVAHPVLINRPIVETARGVRLCRPPETVRELLP